MRTLTKLLSHTCDIDVVNISSIHFDEDKQGNKNIYLNDNLPNDPKLGMYLLTKFKLGSHSRYIASIIV